MDTASRALYRGRAAVEREFGNLKHNHGLAVLRVRSLERVALHVDLTMLARLVLALARARAVPLTAGVPLIVVSRQLGHANPNITAQVYAHLLGDEQLDQAAACFEGLGRGAAIPGAGARPGG